MKLIVLFAVICCIGAAPTDKDSSYKIPSFIKLCYRDKPDFDECLKASIQDLFPRLARGIKELDLIPIDPLYIEEGLYEYGSGSIQGKTLIKDAYTYGLSDAKFTSVKTNFEDPKNIVIEATFHLDRSRVEGTYKQQGRFMNAALTGKGNFNVTGENVTVHWKLAGSLFSNNGEKYLKIKQFIVTPRFGNMIIDANNLFNGNEALSNAMLTLANQYWRLTYDEMLPYTQEVWDKIFRSFANRVFQRIPFDALFLTSQ